MKCPKCNNKLTWRFPHARANEKNFGTRGGATILKLWCEVCKEKWLCPDTPLSHPYQTRQNAKRVRMRVDVDPVQKAWLNGKPNQQATIRFLISQAMTLDKNGQMVI